MPNISEGGDAATKYLIAKDNSAKVAQAINKALAKGLTEIGMLAEGYAKKACPVDTGRLRNSITYMVRPSESAVYIGTNVEYASYVELGTRHQKAQPYLKPAAQDHGKEYWQVLKEALKNG